MEVLLQEQCYQLDEESEWICPENFETFSYSTNDYGIIHGEVPMQNYNYISLQVSLKATWATEQKI